MAANGSEGSTRTALTEIEGVASAATTTESADLVDDLDLMSYDQDDGLLMCGGNDMDDEEIYPEGGDGILLTMCCKEMGCVQDAVAACDQVWCAFTLRGNEIDAVAREVDGAKSNL